MLNNVSNFSDEIANPNFQGFCDPCQCLNCNLIFGAFDVADVIPRQVRFFRELFLAQTSLDPLGADGVAKNFGYFAAFWHNITAEQENEP